VLARSDRFFAKLEELLAENRKSPTRYYDNWPLCAVSEECNIADALLEVSGPDAARNRLRNAAIRMRSTRVVNEDLWAQWHFSMGKVEMRAGHTAFAEAHFALAKAVFISERTLQRERQKSPRAF
jgi:hypothetical protein